MTLAELLVAAVVGTAVAGAAASAAGHLRRAAGEQGARADAAAQLAAGAALLAAELGGAATDPAAPEGGDIAEASDSALELRVTLGAAPVCAAHEGPGGGSTLELAPAGSGLGWWTDEPRAGDVVLVHDPGASPGAADDAWASRRVAVAEAGAAVCASGPFAARPGDGPRWRLALDGPALPPGVTTGAPARVLRRRRYALYRASDSRWYLGGREWDGGGWTGVQPVAGPYEPPVRGGLEVTLVDSAGAAIEGDPPNRRVALAELTLRAERGVGGRSVRDSVRVVVRLRGDRAAP